MIAVPFCDILRVSPRKSPCKKLSTMPRQSSRIKAAALNKSAENDTDIAYDSDQTKNKMANGCDVKTFYSEKASVDILSEVQHNKPARKRKADFEEKTKPDKVKQDSVKQIKAKEIKDEEEEENMEYCDPQENFEGLSEYEKMCRKNIEEKMAFFASLNFDQAKQEFLDAANTLSIDRKPKRKQKYQIKKEHPVMTSVRKSLRLQNISPEGRPLPEKVVIQPVTEVLRKPHKQLTFDEVFQSENQSSEEFVKDMSMLSQEKLKFVSVPYSQYESYFSTMRINPALVTKVAPSRIFSVAIHPSATKTLICAGSKYGHLSFWDVDSKNPQGGVYVYDPHTRPVNCVAFNVDQPEQVISLSYDGTVRCGHLEAGIFSEVFYTSDEDADYTSCSCFDFLSPTSLIISVNDGKMGNVAVVDMRSPSLKEEINHNTHPCVVKCVSVHPVLKNYFISAGRNGVVSLWDLRSLKKNSITDMLHKKSVSSAYFSPVTGNLVLTTSLDNKLSVFDTAQLKSPISIKKSISHDNFTGRWLSPFRAAWLPYSEDAFIVGSMLQPRRIEVFQTNGRLTHNFGGEDLASVCSLNAFHPSRPILVGGNSSGKVHIFIGKE